ncbi:MAG: hypothetical protein HIU84_14965 [Acidobacteria bacterium]|nr:hypothetical protein [Acidobacteriota bacterium]
MSEAVGLGRSDALDSWLGLARHQVALVLAGSIVCGDWLVRTRSSPLELMVGVVFAGASLRCIRGLTIAEFTKVVVLYRVRSRWQRVVSSREDEVVELVAGGTATFRGYELDHRGRLDLSGGDIVNAQRLSELVNGLAVGATMSHVSLHVRGGSSNARTFLTLACDATVCEGWTPSVTLVEEVVEKNVGPLNLVLERWSYLRVSGGIQRVIRVDDFQGATQERALLERLQEVMSHLDLALHVEVVGASRAQRLSARAVHRVGSDAQVARAAGFRRSARAALAAERLSQREELVANGHALLRLGVYITLHCASLSELRDASSELRRRATASGLRLDTGVGRQWSWLCFSLPGGPGW